MSKGRDDREFKILVLGALNWILGEHGNRIIGGTEQQKYYQDWLRRVRELLEETK